MFRLGSRRGWEGVNVILFWFTLGTEPRIERVCWLLYTVCVNVLSSEVLRLQSLKEEGWSYLKMLAYY